MDAMFRDSSLLNSLYARTQADADIFNDRDETSLTSSTTFTVKP